MPAASPPSSKESEEGSPVAEAGAEAEAEAKAEAKAEAEAEFSMSLKTLSAEEEEFEEALSSREERSDSVGDDSDVALETSSLPLLLLREDSESPPGTAWMAAEAEYMERARRTR